MASGDEKECVICFDKSDGMHFGIFSCRACAAFFRRTVSLRLEYNCRALGECPIGESGRNMCRSCRYKKCLAKGMQVSAVQLGRDGIGKRKAPSAEQPVYVPSFQALSPINNVQLPTSVPSPLQQVDLIKSAFSVVQPMKILPKMLEGYRHFLAIRKATHALVEKEDITDRFRRDHTKLRPSNFDSSKKVCQLEAHLVTDIVNSYFPPFSDLQFDEKVNLFKNFFCHLSHTDRAYQSYKVFGQCPENDRLLMPDGGFIKSSDLESFYSNAEGVHSSPAEAARIFRPALDYILNVIIAHMKRIEIDETEYVAILGLLLWNEACQGISSQTMNLIYQTQDLIMNDLHTHYRQIGIDGALITQKTGKLMLLLPKLTKSVMMLRENSALAEMFDIFEADICCKSFKSE